MIRLLQILRFNISREIPALRSGDFLLSFSVFSLSSCIVHSSHYTMNYIIFLMKTDTIYKILSYISEQWPVSPHNLETHFHISASMIHRHLKKLLEKDLIHRLGSAPQVFYIAHQDNSYHWDAFHPSWEDAVFLDTYFTAITPTGMLQEGVSAFSRWCNKRWLDPTKELEYYKATRMKYENCREWGFMIANKRLQSIFSKVYLENTFFHDFYSIEKYGKTRLGTYLYLVKQSPSITVLNRIIDIIQPWLLSLLKTYSIDAIAWIPPSIDRKIQVLDYIEKKLAIPLPTIPIDKIFPQNTKIAQKSLSKLEDRIVNASETIYPRYGRYNFDTVLLIDDALGSWATLNEVAKKLIEKWYAKKVIGYAIVWSANGFDVIQPV